MARYGMEDPEDYNGYYSKSTQANKKHVIIFSLIAVVIVVIIVAAIIKAV